MQLTVKYFGILAEATAVAEEHIQCDICSVAELLKTLENEHPKLGDKEFKIAVNQQLVDHDHKITTEAEIALLPPFAGG